MSKVKYGYFLNRYCSQHNRQYAHVEITIKKIGSSRWDHLLKVQYQNDRESVAFSQEKEDPNTFISNGYRYHAYWYAGKFEADRFSHRSEFKKIARLYYRIDTRLSSNGVSLYNDPAGLIEALEQLGIKRYVWDPRLDKEVLLSELKGLEYTSWRDAIGVGMNGVGIDHDDAVENVDKNFSAYVDEHGWAASRYDEWVAAGRPIQRDERRVLYEHNWPQSTEDILKLEWE